LRILNEKGQVTWPMIAVFCLSLVGGAVGSVVTAYATFVTRAEYNQDIREIKGMLRDLYQHEFGHSPIPPASQSEKNLNRLGPNGACSSWAISTNPLNRLQDYIFGLCT